MKKQGGGLNQLRMYVTYFDDSYNNKMIINKSILGGKEEMCDFVDNQRRKVGVESREILNMV